MPVVVLDTDAASLLHRRQLEPAYARHLIGNTPAITFVTLGELYKGMGTRSWGERRRNDLEGWVDRLLVLPYSDEVARHVGPARRRRAATGTPEACQRHVDRRVLHHRRRPAAHAQPQGL